MLVEPKSQREKAPTPGLDREVTLLILMFKIKKITKMAPNLAVF
jgi:hypothetical protein